MEKCDQTFFSGDEIVISAVLAFVMWGLPLIFYVCDQTLLRSRHYGSDPDERGIAFKPVKQGGSCLIRRHETLLQMKVFLLQKGEHYIRDSKSF